eukprot:COSAG05_NODE_3514_length_2016_cov_2.718203_1_plen_53_part_10
MTAQLEGRRGRNLKMNMITGQTGAKHPTEISARIPWYLKFSCCGVVYGIWQQA